jgi:hypothetical protein
MRQGRAATLSAIGVRDLFYRRYGWDYWTYMSQPDAEIEELQQLISAEGKAIAAAESKQPHAGDRSQEELLLQAHAAGLPVPMLKQN